VISRARNDNFCHIVSVQGLRPRSCRAGFSRGTLTEKKRGYLMKPYRKSVRDAQRRQMATRSVDLLSFGLMQRNMS
jgi:hypothetical protein